MSEKNRRQMESALLRHSRRFYHRLTGPACPVPSLFQLMVFRMGRTSIRQMLADSNRDFTYYRDRGWFESDYYYPAHLGALKKVAGRAFDLMAQRLFRKEAA